MCFSARRNFGSCMNTSVQLKQLVSDTLSQESSVIDKILPASMFGLMKRTKLWELDHMHLCPVIGSCLSIDDLVRFAKRFGFTASLRDQYSMHVEAVDRSNTRNTVSRAIQKHLDTKYRAYIISFNRAKTDDEIHSLWKQHYLRGEVAGAMWAGLTHKAASDQTQKNIYADLHMHSHQIGAGQSADTRRLSQLEKENSEFKAILEHQQRHQASTEAKLRKKLTKALDELESLHQTQSNLVTLQTRIAAFESGEAMIEMGRRLMELTTANDQLRVAAERVPTLEKSLEAAYSGAMALVKERNMLNDELSVLKGLLRVGAFDEESCDEQQLPESTSTFSGCVLCVGGRIALLPQYRKLADQMGIRLIHHDGGQHDALSRLPGLIAHANAVICPTDCVSHAAYYQIKRQCKRDNKACLLFKGAGISNFAKVLTQLPSENIDKHGSAIQIAQ